MTQKTTQTTTQTTHAELDRQVRTLLSLGYPALAGISDEDLDLLVKPLYDLLPEAADGPIPLLLVARSTLVPTA
ncbi:MAG TPA: hypothetical protein VFR87_14655, partial [Nocardioidaceae bacterium]|nr:hypothetical protein [Nocardioidaceae bacterium]